MDRGAWWAAVHGVSKSRTRLMDDMRARARAHTHTHTEVAKNSAKKPSYSECFWSPFHPRLPSGPRGKDVLFIFQ